MKIINRDKYYKKHKACPGCGNLIIKRSAVVITPKPDEDFKDDINKASCEISFSGCGWSGMVNQLKAK